jgi:hypothetical protein
VICGVLLLLDQKSNFGFMLCLLTIIHDLHGSILCIANLIYLNALFIFRNLSLASLMLKFMFFKVMKVANLVMEVLHVT